MKTISTAEYRLDRRLRQLCALNAHHAVIKQHYTSATRMCLISAEQTLVSFTASSHQNSI